MMAEINCSLRWSYDDLAETLSKTIEISLFAVSSSNQIGYHFKELTDIAGLG